MICPHARCIQSQSRRRVENDGGWRWTVPGGGTWNFSVSLPPHQSTRHGPPSSSHLQQGSRVWKTRGNEVVTGVVEGEGREKGGRREESILDCSRQVYVLLPACSGPSSPPPTVYVQNSNLATLSSSTTVSASLRYPTREQF